MQDFPPLPQPSEYLPQLEEALAAHRSGQIELAEAAYRAILKSWPGEPNALHLFGVLHNAQGKYTTGIALIEQAIATEPRMVEAHYNLGNAHAKVGNLEEAEKCYRRAIDLDAKHANARQNYGDLLRTQNRFSEAEAAYRAAVDITPSAALFVRIGVVLRQQRKVDDAILVYEQALQLEPERIDALSNYGNALFDSHRRVEAAAIYRRAIQLDPRRKGVRGSLLACEASVADWTGHLAYLDALEQLQDDVVHPLLALYVSASHRQQRSVAERFALSLQLPQALPRSAKKGSCDRCRIGYLSNDLQQHATAYLFGGVLAEHDRSRFEVIAFSYGPDDGSETRRQIIAGVDQFFDITELTDEQAASIIQRMEIDILVDLKGYTAGSRVGILAHKPAPIQVNFLGYPGTMGVDFIDYIIADPIALPLQEQAHYSEEIVHLKGCYQPNDGNLRIGEPGSRSEHGLPDQGFVFAALNESIKITRQMFEVWMRILARIPDSVLWLYTGSSATASNLRASALQMGIPPDRLVFAPKLPHHEHLARYRHADLFLDTAPYNAHTTASDALRMGVPIVTILGTTFAGRVAASLLHAVGMEELVTVSPAAYEELAVALASDGARLADVRSRLTAQTKASGLFDARRFARDIEDLYLALMRAHGRPA